jgi:hypothetical protein
MHIKCYSRKPGFTTLFFQAKLVILNLFCSILSLSHVYSFEIYSTQKDENIYT